MWKRWRRSSVGCRSWPGSCLCRYLSRWRWAGRAAVSRGRGRCAGGSTEHLPPTETFAADLADFLAALYRVDPTGGPTPGTHNFFRGGPLTAYDSETQDELEKLKGQIDTALAAEVWQAALGAAWQGHPVWFHGDAQPGNLLLDDAGRLSAVIDFGTCGIGDPACDTTIAWTFLSGESSRVFKERLPVDSGTWIRGRGWAIWKAMKVLIDALKDDPDDAAYTKHVIDKILADHLADR